MGENSGQKSTFRQKMKKSEERIKKALRDDIRFDIGRHKKTKLKRAVGVEVAERSLFNKVVAERHAERLHAQFDRRWGTLSKSEMLDRLKFWTVLHSVCLVDEDDIAAELDAMERDLRFAASSVKGIEVIGVIEIEIINITLMKTHAALGPDSDEARKLNVIEAMVAKARARNSVAMNYNEESVALVHFHGVIDFGVKTERKLPDIAKASRDIWTKTYQVQFGTFHANKNVSRNLAFIAKYLVKGGNEALVYKFGFGWDTVERLEARMLKRGKKNMGADFEGYVNEMSLTVREIRVLVNSIDRLIDRYDSNMRNGYIFRHGQQVR